MIEFGTTLVTGTVSIVLWLALRIRLPRVRLAKAEQLIREADTEIAVLKGANAEVAEERDRLRASVAAMTERCAKQNMKVASARKELEEKGRSHQYVLNQLDELRRNQPRHDESAPHLKASRDAFMRERDDANRRLDSLRVHAEQLKIERDQARKQRNDAIDRVAAIDPLGVDLSSVLCGEPRLGIARVTLAFVGMHSGWIETGRDFEFRPTPRCPVAPLENQP